MNDLQKESLEGWETVGQKNRFFMNMDTARAVAYRESVGVDEEDFQELVEDYYLQEWDIDVEFDEDGVMTSTNVQSFVLQIYVFPELGYNPFYIEGFEACQLENAVQVDYGIVLTLLEDYEFEGTTLSAGTGLVVGQYLYQDILKKCKNHGIHTTVDTSGYCNQKSFEKIIPFTD